MSFTDTTPTDPVEELAKAFIAGCRMPDRLGDGLPEREKILGEWFAEGDTGLLFAPRGAGKTWLSLSIAIAIANGSKLGPWQSTKPRGVCYVDSEMPAKLMRQRLDGMDPGGCPGLVVLSHEHLFEATGKTLNFADPDQQAGLTRMFEKMAVSVVVLDNRSTGCRGMIENDNDGWEVMENWLLSLRRKNIAVLLVDHTGKNGSSPRGASKREDAVTWSLSIKSTKSDEDRGAKFTSEFSKPSRNTPEAQPRIEWHFQTDVTGIVTYTAKAGADAQLDELRELVEGGLKRNRDIAEAMGEEKWTVSRLLAKALKAGWLRKVGEDYVMN